MKYGVGVVCLLVCLQCSQSSQEIQLSMMTPKVEKVAGNQLAALGHFARAVPLETRDEALVGSIHQVHLDPHRGDILVGDYKVQRRVLRFDAQGKFIRAYGAQGQGPGEFQSLMGFAPVGDGRLVVLGNYKIAIFDYDGEVVAETFMESGAVDVAVQNDHIFLRTLGGAKHDGSEMVVYGMDLSPQKDFLPIERGHQGIPFLARRGLVHQDGSFFLAASFDNFLTTFNTRGELKHRIKFPGGVDVAEDLDRAAAHRLDRKERVAILEKIVRPAEIFGVGEGLFIHFTVPGEKAYRPALYRPHDQQLTVFPQLTVMGEQEGSQHLVMDYVAGSYDKGLVGVCESPERFNRFKEGVPVLEPHTLKATDNPILIFFELGAKATYASTQ